MAIPRAQVFQPGVIAPRVQPVDTSGVLKVIDDFANIAEKRYQTQAMLQAESLGTQAGATAETQPRYDRSTEAGDRAYRFSRDAFLSRLGRQADADVRQAQADWTEGTKYGGDTEKLRKDLLARRDTYLSALDEETAGLYGQSFSEPFDRFLGSVAQEEAKRARGEIQADIEGRVLDVGRQAVIAAGNGDSLALKESATRFHDLLASPYIDADKREALTRGLDKDIRMETYWRDFLDAEDPEGFATAFEAARQDDLLVTDEKERLLSRMQTHLNTGKEEKKAATVETAFRAIRDATDDPAKQSKLLDQVDPAIAGAVRERLKADNEYRLKLEKDRVDADSSKRAREIFQAGGSEAEMLGKVALIGNPDLADDTRKKLTGMLSAKRQADDEAYNAQNNPWWYSFTQNPTPEAINAAKWMKDEDRRSAWNFLEEAQGRARSKARGEYTVTDPETLYRLTRMAGENPAGYQRENLVNYLDRLSPNDFRYLINMQTNILGGQKDAKSEMVRRVGDGVLKSIGINPNAKDGTEEYQRAARFQARLWDAASDLDPADPTTMETRIREEANKLAVEGKKGRAWWFDKTTRAFETDQRPDYHPLAPDFSFDDAAAAEAKLKARGLEVTEESLKRLLELSGAPKVKR